MLQNYTLHFGLVHETEHETLHDQYRLPARLLPDHGRDFGSLEVIFHGHRLASIMT
jgi:hypothetical protein